MTMIHQKTQQTVSYNPRNFSTKVWGGKQLSREDLDKVAMCQNNRLNYSCYVYCKIPKISNGAYIFKRPAFLRGIFVDRLFAFQKTG